MTGKQKQRAAGNKIWFTLFAFFTLSAITFSSHAQVADPPSRHNALLEMADKQGKTAVIVDFDIPFKFLGHKEAEQLEQQRTLIALTAKNILERNRKIQFKNVQTYRNLPHMALVTDREGILALLADPDVRNVSPNKILAPTPSVEVIDPMLQAPPEADPDQRKLDHDSGHGKPLINQDVQDGDVTLEPEAPEPNQ